MLSGHRGYRAAEVENTAVAFERAIRAGVDYVEFDVRRTRDGHLVVFHDRRVDRLLNARGPLAGFTLSQLRRLRYADDQRVLTLDELFEEFRGRVKFLLEIKDRGIEERVVAAIGRAEVEGDVIVQSFSGRDVAGCRRLAPDLTYGLCLGPVGKVPGGDATRLHRVISKFAYQLLVARYPVTWLNLDGPYLYDAFVEHAHRMGKRVILGAARTAAYLDKLETWHVEMINADDPVDVRRRVKALWGDHFLFSTEAGQKKKNEERD
ncbi:MAG: hypothetical protein Kow0069_23400 [Promethearchaeota archaeon]